MSWKTNTNWAWVSKPVKVDKFLQKVEEMAQNEQLRDEMKFRRLEMLEDKMDVAQFLTWFIGQYPYSIEMW